MPDKINRDQIEEEYGLSYALFKAFPELDGLLRKAVAGNWTPSKFQVELRQTTWYKRHSDVWRQNTALKYADPATYRERLNDSLSNLNNLAANYSVAKLGEGSRLRLAERALLFGWDEGQMRNVLSRYVRPNAVGHYAGELASVEQNIRNTAFANGIRVNGAYIRRTMRAITRGAMTSDQAENHIREVAARTFSLYGDQIRGGVDLIDVASPYTQSMSEILELNPGSLDLFDPTIRRALSGTRDKNRELVPVSISDFEDSLRRDKRWQYTDSAKEQAKGYAASLARMWGVG